MPPGVKGITVPNLPKQKAANRIKTESSILTEKQLAQKIKNIENCTKRLDVVIRNHFSFTVSITCVLKLIKGFVKLNEVLKKRFIGLTK